MRSSTTSIFVLLAAVSLVASCGSDDGDQPQGEGQGAGAIQLAQSEIPLARELKSAGFEVIVAKPFPAQSSGRTSKVVVYRSRSDDDVGGVIYAARRGADADRLVWHWYFTDAAPDSITPIELNDDGLWDVRVHLNNREVLEYTQGADFSFRCPMRQDHIAMNARASEQANVWKAFDGDTMTVWRSPVGRKGAWIDVPTPLGVSEGVLIVRIVLEGQPKRCAVEADGKAIKEFDLQATTGEQVFQLGEAAQGAKTVRLSFYEPRHGRDEVLVGELGIR